MVDYFTFGFCYSGGEVGMAMVVTGEMLSLILSALMVVVWMLSAFYSVKIKQVLQATWVGMAINQAVNQLLRSVIKQPRPTGIECIYGYGMPCHETQVVSFFATSVMFYPETEKKYKILGVVLTILNSASLNNNGICSIWQCAAGVAAGVLLASLTHTVTKKYVLHGKTHPKDYAMQVVVSGDKSHRPKTRD